MDQNDRMAIDGLFDKLRRVSDAQTYRDPEAERLIADLIARTPGAAYYLAQTVIMQEQALNSAQDQIAALEARSAQSGGLLGRLFGGAPQPAPRPMAPRARPMPEERPDDAGMAPGNAGPWANRRPAGGGFMAGAAQTAMGVAGGVLLGNAIGSMFASPAEASEATGAEEELQPDDGGFDDGFDDGGFE